MAWMRRLLNTFRRPRLDRDIERELSFHLAERTDALRDEGLNPAEAAREARRRFGSALVQKERTLDVDITRWLDALLRDARYAIRGSLRSPTFSATVVLTIAVGIGANTAVFSAIDAVLLKPLPVPDGERLVRVLEFVEGESDQDVQIAPARLEEWASRTTSLDALTGYYVEDISDTTGTLPERVRRAVISPRFLDVWQVAPVLGRDFSESEYLAGGAPTVLISDRYWRTRFGADPGVLSKVVRIEGEAFAIAGVMPASFRFPDPTVDVWWPYPVDGVALADTPQSRRHRWYTGVGRLRAGVTVEQARADLQTIQSALAAEYPQTDGGIVVRMAPLKQTMVGDVGRSLWLLYGAVSVLLLIACANIASLWLSRTAQREDEAALRFSLGASRASVARQCLVETAMLSCLGAVLGVVVALAASSVIRVLLPNLPRADEIGLDGRVLAYTTTSALLVTLLCGVLPALRSARVAPSHGSSARTQVGGRHAAQWAMVGLQVALSMTLLAGAGLLVRSASALSRVEPGFDPGRVLALRMSANWGETSDRAGLVARIGRVLDHLAGVPGVAAAATSWSLPGIPRRYQVEFSLVEGRASSEPRLLGEWRSVAPAYFSALSIPLASGEWCRQPMPEPATAELMVNRGFAERHFRDRSPVGLHLSWEEASLTGRIVGIVGDARESGMDREAPPTVYTCDSAPTPFPWILVRTKGEPADAAVAVRSALKEIEPLRSVYDMAPLEERIAGAYAQTRARTSLLAAFAATALLLACLGVYATLSYAISMRRREMGLRLALGATRSSVIRLIVWQAVRVVLAGCALGMVTALAGRDVLSGMLYGVSPSDTVALAVSVGIQLAVAGLAALFPAVRGSSVEPMRVLRE